MTTPTVPVTVNLAAMGGPALPNITVIATLDANEVYNGVVVAMKVSAKTDNTGVAVLNLFPNAPAPAGLGTRGTSYRVTATIPGGRSLNVDARVPNSACRLENILVLEAVGPLSAAELALLQAQSSLSEVSANAASAAASALAASGSASTATTKASEAAGSKAGADAAAAAAGASASAAGAAATAAAGSATAADAARIAAEAALAAGGAGIDPDSLSDVTSLTGAERIATKQGGNMRGLDVDVLKDYLLNGGKDAAFNLAQALTAAFGTKYGYSGTIGIGGGSVTQATSKAQAVTLNCAAGQVTLNAASLAAGAQVAFTLNNTSIAADDEVYVWKKGGGTAGAYEVEVDSVSAGSCSILVKNTTAGPLSEALIIGFSVRSAAIFPVVGSGGGSGMKFGLNMSGTANFSGGSPFNNLLYMMGAMTRMVGTTDFTQEQGKVTTTSSTDEFRGVLIDTAHGEIPGLYGEYTVLNPSGVTVGAGSFDTPNALAYSNTTTPRTFNYTGGNLCYMTKGQTNLTAGPPVIVKTSNLASWLAGCVWSPEFLAFHSGLKEQVMRFMDWGNASVSVETAWTDRCRPDLVSVFRQGMPNVPWEFMIDLCNRLSVDAWAHIGHRCTDAYVANAKAMWHDGTGRVAVPNIASLQNATGLLPARTLYGTVGNETWNNAPPWHMGFKWFLLYLHTKYDVTVSPQADDQLVNWTGHGLTTGAQVALLTTPQVEMLNITDGNPAADGSANAWMVKYASTMSALVIDADHIKLQWVDGGVTNTMRFPKVAQYTGEKPATLAFKAVKLAEFPAEDYDQLHHSYGTRCKEVWAQFKTAMGSRFKSILESQAAGDHLTELRLEPSGVAVATDLLAIAPYFVGEYMMATIDLLSGTSFRPRFWCMASGAVHINVVAAGATRPTDEQLESHTGGGIITGHVLNPYISTSGTFSACTDETGLTAGNSYDVYVSYRNSEPARAPYFWTFKTTITMAAGKTATSTTSNTVDGGSKTFTVATGKTFAAGEKIAVYRTSAPAVYMDGTVASYNSGTGALAIDVGRAYQNGGGAGPFTDWTIGVRQYVYDTFVNQRDRNKLDTLIGDMPFLAAHKLKIAASANPAIKLACYESGNHMEGHGAPTEMSDWLRGSYLESADYAAALEHNMREFAAEPDMEIQCIFSEITKTVWEIATTHFDTADQRYQKLASFNGFVPRATLPAVSDLDVPVTTAPGSYPATIYTMADASLTYEIIGGNTAGQYSFVGAALKLNNGTGINWTTSASKALYCRVSNGQVDKLFKITVRTGPALWYPPAAKLAMLTKNTNPTTPVAEVGSITPSSTPAVAVADGWDMNGVADYGAGAAMLYTESPLYSVALRKNGDTSAYLNHVVFAGKLSAYNNGSNLSTNWGGHPGADIPVDVPFDNTLCIVSWWFDDANQKLYVLKNKDPVNVGGTAYTAAQPAGSGLGAGGNIGGGTHMVYAGVLATPAPGTLANTQSIIQSMMTELGIS